MQKNPRKISYLLAAVILILVVTLSSSMIFLGPNLNAQMMASNTAPAKMDIWGDIGGFFSGVWNMLTGGFQAVASFGSSTWGNALTNMYQQLVIDIPPPMEQFYYGSGNLMLGLFYKMRDLSFAFFALVLVFAGVCYLLENFRLMDEGTAFHILTSSMFTLIIIYLLPDIYNILSNGFMSLFPWILTKVSGPMSTTPTDPIILLGNAVTASGLGNPFMALLVMICSSTCILLGVARYVIFYGVIIFMPVALVLRLIPITQRIGEDIFQALLGFFIASILSCVIVEVGAIVYCFYSMGGAMAGFWGSAVLLAGAFIPTLFIPRLGGLFSAMTVAASAAAAGAQQFVSKSLTGVAMGAAGGAIGGAAGGAGEALGTAGEVTTGGSSGTMGRAKLLIQQAGMGALKGGLGGAAEGATKGRKMGPHMLSAGVQSGLATGSANTRASLEKTATQNMGNLMNYFAYNPTGADAPTAAAEGDNYQAQIAHTAPERVGHMVLTQTGLGQSSLAEAEIKQRMGGAYQSKLAGFDSINARRVQAGMANYHSMLLSGKQAECDKLVKAANEFDKTAAERTQVIKPPTHQVNPP